MAKENDTEPLQATFRLIIVLALFQFILLTYTRIIDFTDVWQAILHAIVQWAGPKSGRGQSTSRALVL
jgi:hypothetical protein